MYRNRTIAAASAVLIVTALSACSASSSADEDDGRLRVVASTSVWGDIAATVGGDHVNVTSIIDSPDQDPHSYEASAQDQLALSRADLVIENGGGYDPYIDTLLEASGSTASVLNASEASGLLKGGEPHPHSEAQADEHAEETEQHGDHQHVEGFNEHVWYSFTAVDNIAHTLAHQLGELDPANRERFHANYEALAASIGELVRQVEAVAAETGDAGAAVTEPVPVYLLEAAGLVNETPEAFTEAIEEGGDVPPAALQQTLELFTDGTVVVLGYNDQTASPETERVREAAEEAGIPVVAFTETLPDGSDYVSWMSANLDALATAIRR